MSDKFSINDLDKKGFVLNQKTGQYEPRNLFSDNLNVFPKSLLGERNSDAISDAIESTVKLDVPTSWFVKGNVPSKKNSRNIFVMRGRLMNLPSDKHKEYVVSTQMQYTVFGIEFRRAVNFYALKYPLYVEFTFVRGTKHAFDYGNACATVEDIIKDEYKSVKQGDKKVKVLVSKNWLPDDSADYLIPVFQPYEYNKQNPGVRIKLLLK